MENKINILAETLETIQNQIKSYELEIKENNGLSLDDSKHYEKLKVDFKDYYYEYHKLIADENLSNDYDGIDIELVNKYNYLKQENLKLVAYYKYFNPVEEIFDKKTENGKNKKAYKRLEKIKAKYKPLKKISAERIAKVEMCNRKFVALTDITFKKSKIVKTIKCRDKFCAVCQKIKSTKTALSLQVLDNYINDEYNYEEIFVTLTAPNVKGDELKNEIEEYNKSFKKLLKYPSIKKINKGYVLSLEITYNFERDDFHPHYHIKFRVPKSYFSNYYITHSKWLEMWQKAKKDKTITQVDVRRVNKKNKKGISNDNLELSKYIAKSSDFLIDLDVFETYYNSTYRKRFLSFGGVYKDAMKKFKNDELEKYKTFDDIDWEFIIDYTYRVQDKTYKKNNLRKLTEEEKMKIKINELKNLQRDFEDML